MTDTPSTPRRRKRKRTPTRLLSPEQKQAKWKRWEANKQKRQGERPPCDPAGLARELGDMGPQLLVTHKYLKEGAEDPGGTLAWTNAHAFVVGENLREDKKRARKSKHRPPRPPKTP